MKHTQVTWKAQGYFVTLQDGTILLKSPIADLTEDVDITLEKQNEAMANVKLAAAAPELLEALQRLLDRLESETHSLAISGSINTARQAINKATQG